MSNPELMPQNMETAWRLEDVIVATLREKGVETICPPVTRIAKTDLINYLKHVWNIELDELLWLRLGEKLSTSEFRLFLRNWAAEWTYQWQKRVKIVADISEVPKRQGNRPAPWLPLELFKELKWAAIRTMITHRLICGTETLSEEVVKQSAGEVKQTGKSEMEWAVALLAKVCRNARALAQTTGVLLWLVLPPKPAQEGNSLSSKTSVGGGR